MTFRSTFAKSVLTGVAGVMAMTAAMSVPTFASAQPYAGSGGYYDPCRRESTNRGTVGALIGGALGAAIGSNAAARNARTEGALLGGALGAVGGAAVGKNSAACAGGYRDAYRPTRPSYYDNQSYGNRSGARDDYDRSGYYAGSYDRDDRYYDGPYAYDRRGNRYSVAQAPGADGCTLAESPIYLPDGRVQKRFVRVCQDSAGNYQVVD